MPTPLDCAISFAPETTYGTAGTVFRTLEFLSESLDYKKGVKQSEAMRSGNLLDRASRRTIVTREGGGSIDFEAQSRGFGLLLQALMGAGSSTLVSVGLYQQVHTLGKQGDGQPAVTIAKVVPQTTGSNFGLFSFLGSVATDVEFDFGNADILKLKTSWDSQDVTATSSATVTPALAYPAQAGSLFTFAGASLSTGALTAPTATALASAANPICVRSGNIKVSHGMAVDRFNTCVGGGKKAKPTVGKRSITGSLTVEYDGTTMVDQIMQDAGMPLIATWTSGADVLQVVLAHIRIDSELPRANGGQLVTHPVNFTALMPDSGEPMWVVLRTADAAL